jgi:hypothetical protein
MPYNVYKMPPGSRLRYDVVYSKINPPDGAEFISGPYDMYTDAWYEAAKIIGEESRRKYLDAQGYTKKIELNHKIGYTELAVHCRLAGQIAVEAWVIPGDDDRYGFVKTSQGGWTEGLLNIFEDLIAIS